MLALESDLVCVESIPLRGSVVVIVVFLSNHPGLAGVLLDEIGVTDEVHDILTLLRFRGVPWLVLYP